jgi:hypothetical protein
MGTAGVDRSAAEIAVELSRVQNLRLDGRRMKNLLYIYIYIYTDYQIIM